jgi:hypothetical protein
MSVELPSRQLGLLNMYFSMTVLAMLASKSWLLVEDISTKLTLSAEAGREEA